MPICTKMYKPMPLAPLHVVNDVEKPKLELKVLPPHLKYAFLDDISSFPIIISSDLNSVEEEKLLRVLRDHKSAIGWSIEDLKGISSSVYMHRTLMEDTSNPSVEHQRRLNLAMKEVVKK